MTIKPLSDSNCSITRPVNHFESVLDQTDIFKYISSRIGFVSANQLKLKGNLAKTRVQPTPSVGEVNLGLSKVKHFKSDPGRTQKVSQSHETN